MFLYGEVIPVIRELVLNTGLKNAWENDSGRFNIERRAI